MIIRHKDNIESLGENFDDRLDSDIFSDDDYLVRYNVCISVKEPECITKYKNNVSVLNSIYYRAVNWIKTHKSENDESAPDDIRKMVFNIRKVHGNHEVKVKLRNISVLAFEIPMFFWRLYGILSGKAKIYYESALTKEAIDELRNKYDETIVEDPEFEGCIDSSISLSEANYHLCATDIWNILIHKYASGILDKEHYDGDIDIRLTTFTR